MNLRKPLILGTAAFALVVGSALPASAADTVTTFALTGGSLAVSVQATAALTNEATSVAANDITGSLGAVSVTDDRGGTVIWNATGASTAFKGALTGGSSSTAVTYTAGVVTETGTITVADGTVKTLTATAVSVVAPTSLSGNNTASWNPTLVVSMPAGALKDTYSGTVTTSVA